MQEFIYNEAKKFAKIVHHGTQNYYSLKKLQPRFEEELTSFSGLSSKLYFINSFEKEVTGLFKDHLEKCTKTDTCTQHLTYKNSKFLIEQERETIQNLLSNETENTFKKGDFFDAYKAIVDIINLATTSIKLIDNYVDHNTLEFFTHKKNNEITVKILTKRDSITTTFENFTEKFKKQYGNLEFRVSDIFHDRFLILDDSIIYMIGASIKDVGKKVFMLNKVESLEIKNLILDQFHNEWLKSGQ